jgi:hypothetical protein
MQKVNIGKFQNFPHMVRLSNYHVFSFAIPHHGSQATAHNILYMILLISFCPSNLPSLLYLARKSPHIKSV